MKVGFLVAGFKGSNFLKSIHKECDVSFVSSYEKSNNFINDIKTICHEHNYNFFYRKSLNNSIFDATDIIFVVGWQYILSNFDERFVVLHDSLLPKFRGFAPTVSALILGYNKIGVTALKPVNIGDAGDIYEQESLEINYPIKIKDAYLGITSCYVKVAKNILIKAANELLVSFPQDESSATYSIWRDEEDYYIDWNWDSEKISRFIDAVGYPYDGAKTIYKSKVLYIDEVIVDQDRNFEERHPGKIWRLNQGSPTVVCGKGMLQILSARNEDGSRVIFDSLRERLTKN